MSSVNGVATTLSSESVLKDHSMFGHPKGLGLLFFVEMWERFSYYGMRALLILYLVNHLEWSDSRAAHLYGTYTGLVYLTPIFGGWLADQFIGTRRSLVIGAIIIALGHFTLAFESMPMFYTGLGLIIVGTGFFKPNVSTMVGQLYPEGDSRRDAGFTIFYMGINLGAFIAPLICGYLGQKIGWHWGFGAAGVGMVLGLVTYLWGRDRYLPGIGLAKPVARTIEAGSAIPSSEVDSGKAIKAGIIGALLGAGLAFLSNASWLPLLMSAVAGGVVAATLIDTQGEERKRVIALFILIFFTIFFWTAFEQAGSSMNLFADRYTNLTLGSFEFPSSWFQSVNSLFILLLAPVFGWIWVKLAATGREPSTPLKMAIGLILLGLGFIFLVFGAKTVDSCIAVYGRGAAECAIASPMWLVLAIMFHTLGELCLSPVGLSYVTKVAPAKFVSLLMGGWFMSSAAANYLGGWLAGRTETIESQSLFFSIPVATSIGSALILLMLVPMIKNLTKSVKA